MYTHVYKYTRNLLANCSQRAQTNLLPILVNQVLLKSSHAYSFGKAVGSWLAATQTFGVAKTNIFIFCPLFVKKNCQSLL